MAFRAGFLFSGCAEWGAGAASSPNRSVWRPSGELEGERPAADACEKMGLGVAFEVFRLDFGDAAFIDVAGWDKVFGNQFA